MSIEIHDAVPGSVRIRRAGPSEWRVKQRVMPPPHDNAQAVTWLRIENGGKAACIAVELAWAAPAHMPYRCFGYVRRGGKHEVIYGQIGDGITRYEFTARAGVSYFGPVPWYDNADGERFISRKCKVSTWCHARTLGHSGEGRPIRCLTVAHPRARKRHILLVAREHATESSGSFALEAVTEYLLSAKGRDLLREGHYHIVPIANPDGVAHGTKITRMGPPDEVDLYQGGLTSADATARILRESVLALRPACLLSYHSYLQSEPACMFFNKCDGMIMLDYLLDVDNWILARGPMTWKGRGEVKSVWHVNRMPSGRTLWGHCHKAFRTVVSMPELSWHGRTMEELRHTGLVSFLAAMRALQRRPFPKGEQ